MQELAEGVTVMIPEIPDAPLLVALKDGTADVPDAATPIPVLELVQLYVAAATLPLKVVAGTKVPLQ